MKYLLILLISIIILSSFLVSCEKKIGHGIIISTNGDKYVGEWKKNKRYGNGTLIWSNGRKYVGEYNDGKRNGQGTFTWSDGKNYVREFKDGKFNGQGKLDLLFFSTWRRDPGRVF